MRQLPYTLQEGRDHEPPSLEGLPNVELDIPAPLSRENFICTAGDVAGIYNEGKRDGRPGQAIDDVLAYEKKAGNPQLALLVDLVSAATLAQGYQVRIDSVRAQMEKLASKQQDQAELSSLASKEAELRDLLLRFNQGIRNLAFANPETFTRTDLEGWLTMGGANSRFINGVTKGISMEVAGGRLLARVPGVLDVQLPSIEDDANGADLWLMIIGDERVKVDIKTGDLRPADKLVIDKVTGQRKLIFGIAEQYLGPGGFDIRPEYVPMLCEDAGKLLELTL